MRLKKNKMPNKPKSTSNTINMNKNGFLPETLSQNTNISNKLYSYNGKYSFFWTNYELYCSIFYVNYSNILCDVIK